LAPYGAGLDLAKYARRLHAFPKADAWSVYMRRTLVPLDGHDSKLLLEALDKIAVQPSKAVGEYLARGKPPQAKYSPRASKPAAIGAAKAGGVHED
jgi:hypothetical protein